ncbi:hypothetical protein K523DRAFT_45385 [Schizophyllum commune Tattone D]|nr:hypothetical protein K523DRAFT_45385 [Schizophyllum commune Tattone D]
MADPSVFLFASAMPCNRPTLTLTSCPAPDCSLFTQWSMSGILAAPHCRSWLIYRPAIGPSCVYNQTVPQMGATAGMPLSGDRVLSSGPGWTAL